MKTSEIITRLNLAKEKKEGIAVWGDYDADGICGATIFFQTLKHSGFKNLFLFLSWKYGRFGEKTIKSFSSLGISLCILIDMNVEKIEDAKLAKNSGIDLIVIDHHLPNVKKNASLPFTFYHSLKKAASHLSFELAKKFFSPAEELELCLTSFEDLAYLGSLCDRIPKKLCETKIILSGRKKLFKGERLGFKILLKKIGIKKITEKNENKLRRYFEFPFGEDEDNSFYQLFISKDKEKLNEIATRIVRNYQIAGKMMKKFSRKLSPIENKKRIIFIENTIGIFIPGFNGVLANYLMEKAKKPVFVYSQRNNLIRASGRAPKGYHLVNKLKKCSELFRQFGGHPQAVGFQAESENLEKIVKNL